MIAKILIRIVEFYRRYLSNLLGQGKCRFIPSCSEYAVEALQTHGAFKGTLLALWRVLRCHPWGGQGYDPVPPQGLWPKRKHK